MSSGFSEAECRVACEHRLLSIDILELPFRGYSVDKHERSRKVTACTRIMHEHNKVNVELLHSNRTNVNVSLAIVERRSTYVNDVHLFVSSQSLK